MARSPLNMKTKPVFLVRLRVPMLAEKLSKAQYIDFTLLNEGSSGYKANAKGDEKLELLCSIQQPGTDSLAFFVENHSD